jgi:methionyl-tRNA formyltransferase
VARLAFLGSPEVAAICLEALLDAGHDVVLVVSGPDRRRGRGGLTSPTPVKRLSIERGLRVSDALEDAASCGADLGVVVAYGRIVPSRLLDALDFVNVHFSLLPRWRGAAPVERAILAGDDETGVCLMKLDTGLDTGPVYACRSTSIGPGESADELRLRLARLGSELLVERLAGGPASLGQPVVQDRAIEATYASKLSLSELELDWRRSAIELDRVVRVGRAWTRFRGRRLIVWRASPSEPGRVETDGLLPGALVGTAVVTGDGLLDLVQVQEEGRPRLSAAEWARGARIEEGEALG